MTRPSHIVLSLGLSDPAIGEVLREKGPLLLEIPENCVYHILRPPPPGGWRRTTRNALRAGLFPDPLEFLWWDEAVLADGSWEIWGLPIARLREMLGTAEGAVLAANRRLRIFPEGSDRTRGLSGFPNLAPPQQRPLRIPWPRLQQWARWGLPLAVLIGGTLATLLILKSRWVRLEVEHEAQSKAVQSLESSVTRERGNLESISRLQAPAGVMPRWARDLDALTRLLPEDTRLAGLKWQMDEVQIDLLTPQPERIREILQAAPEFTQVRFVGNLERRGEKSRLVLVLRPKEGR